MKNAQGQVYVRFDGPPGPEAGRFVEVERDGASIKFGEWVQDGEYWLLVLPAFPDWLYLADGHTPERDTLYLATIRPTADNDAYRGKDFSAVQPVYFDADGRGWLDIGNLRSKIENGKWRVTAFMPLPKAAPEPPASEGRKGGKA